MHHIDIQLTETEEPVPDPEKLKGWAQSALHNHVNDAELTIRIVDTDEITALNDQYRHKNKATNVLSFPAPDYIRESTNILGDIVVCASVVNSEAQQQAKQNTAHWAHMIIHGVFHLLGFDHENEQDAEEMENLEIVLLQELGYPNPYQTGEHIKDND